MDVVGLDFQVLPTLFAIYDVPKDEQQLLFEKLVIINAAGNEHRGRQREMQKAKQKAEAELKKFNA